MFAHEVCINKINKDKSTGMFPPLLLTQTNTVYAHAQCREPKKDGKRFQF